MVRKEKENQIILKTPASWWGALWREALPSGNGKIGAAVYGAAKDETVVINHAELWRWGRKSELPDVSHTLAETRRLMAEGKHLEASWHLTNTLKERGYDTRLASRLPLGALKLSMPCERAFRDYRRSVDMDTGEVSVAWKEGQASYERTLFVSRAHDMIVYRLAVQNGSLRGDIALAMHKSGKPHLAEQLKELEESVEVRSEDGYFYYAATNDDGTDFGAVLRVVPEGGELTEHAEGIRFAGAGGVLALVKTFVKDDRAKAWPRLQAELASVMPAYDALLAEHVRLHRPLFRSASVRIGSHDGSRANEELLLEAYGGEAPDELVQKMWAYGRYLFISGTCPEGQPFGLYGLWAGDYRLTWGHHMANENIQMMYWHAPAGGLIDLMPSLIRYYDSMMDDFRACARKLYGCRGVYIPAGTTPGIGYPNQIVPVIMNWTGAAGWLASHYYEYYLYTGDTSFLRDNVLPFMREAALFYEDFLVEDADGRLMMCPSVSPENTPQNFMPEDGKPLAHPMPTAINATMDFAILKELLTRLIEGSAAAQRYEDEIPKWRRMLERIPPYQVNEDGAVREWMHPDFDDRYDHRHLSHIYPIFPGKELTREENPELFQAFETAVRKRLIGAQTGWSLAHMSAIYARLGSGDDALECLDVLSRSCLLNNFFTVHNDWRQMGVCMNMPEAPVQLDAALGWTNAVQEMLLYASPGKVKLLPALPNRWRQGQFEGLRFCTGSVDCRWDWDAGCFEAVITAERDTQVTVSLPEQFRDLVWSGAAEGVTLAPGASATYIVTLEAGKQAKAATAATAAVIRR